MAWPEAFHRAIFLAKGVQYPLHWAGIGAGACYWAAAVVVTVATIGLRFTREPSHVGQSARRRVRRLAGMHLASLLVVGGGLWVLFDLEAATVYLVYQTVAWFALDAWLVRRESRAWVPTSSVLPVR